MHDGESDNRKEPEKNGTAPYGDEEAEPETKNDVSQIAEDKANHGDYVC